MKLSSLVIPVAAILAGALPARASAQATTPDTVPHKAGAITARDKPHVTRVANTVQPKYYTGKCPGTLHWSARITVVNPPVTVKYEWIRSDGAKSPAKQILIRGTEGIIGGDSWQLGGDGEKITLWERVHVFSPNQVYSNVGSVKVTCR